MMWVLPSMNLPPTLGEKTGPQISLVQHHPSLKMNTSNVLEMLRRGRLFWLSELEKSLGREPSKNV